jgi:hypothetical protein
MLARQLDYAPSADELQFTCRVMVDDLHRHGFTDADGERILAAFIALGPMLNRWPTARMVIDAVPDKKRAKELPAPQADPAIVATYVDKLRAKTGGRRKVLLPCECYADYQAALLASGRPKADFDMERMAHGGWTPALEAEYRKNAARVGFHLT